MIAPIPPVVPAGRMSENAQPVLDLPDGLELRPWRATDADALEGTMRGALLHADGWHDQHLHARVRGDE